MKSFRKVLFWLHLIAGVVGGIVIFIMCVTGALLSFEKNITEFAERDARNVPLMLDAPHLPVSVVLDKVRAARPDAKISGLTELHESNAALQINLGRDGQLFANPYTGEITGESSKDWHDFFGVVEDLHRWIAFPGGRAVGKALTGACNLMFLFLAISGIYIWFPRRWSWKHFRAAMVFRWKVKGKARDFNWHTVLGFWSSLVLIVLTLTATVISYQWAGNLLYTLTGTAAPQQQQQGGGPPNAPGQQNEQPFVVPENLDRMWAKAKNQSATWKSISLRLPITKDASAFTIDEGIYWNIFGRSTLTIDAKTTEISKWESYGEQNSARQLRSWFRFTHTGETGGLVGQFIGFLACLGGAVLVYTGFALAWRRFRNWKSKSAASNAHGAGDSR